MSKNLEKIEIKYETLTRSQKEVVICNQREKLKKMMYPLVLGILSRTRTNIVFVNHRFFGINEIEDYTEVQAS